MIDYLTEPTLTTPYVFISSTERLIEIQGRSAPENALRFYFPILKRIKDALKKSRGVFEVRLSFQYFNTSSAKCIFDMLKMLKRFDELGRPVKVIWAYEEDDEDMLETGEDFEDLLDMNFEYEQCSDISSSFYKKAV